MFGHLKTIADVSVTATPQKVELPTSDRPYIMRNLAGGGNVYYRYDPKSTTAAMLGATEAALRALGASKLTPANNVSLPPIPYIELVCATGETATVSFDCGTLVNPA
jgi:hypothetical protein